VNLPFIDRIWRVRGSLPLEGASSPADAFGKLDPLFQTTGTNYRIDGDTLTYSNRNPAAQDKLATFTRGTLRVAGREGPSKLVYDLTSPALLFCFLAPLLFLGFGQLTVAIGKLEKPATEESGKPKKDEKKDEVIQLNPIDKFLGAPEPEKPKTDKEKAKEKEKDKGQDKEHSPTAAYVFAAIFATLYLVGRFLEPWLVRRTFRKSLSGEASSTQTVGAAK
jgi:hypothetical protein